MQTKINYKGHEISLKIRKANNHVLLWFCRIDGAHAFSSYGIDEPSQVQVDRAKAIIDQREEQEPPDNEPMFSDTKTIVLRFCVKR